MAGHRTAEHTLILLRHAKSDWSGEEPDIARPLAKRGRRQAPDTGRWLADNIHGIDLAVVSPASRARSTWELVSAELHPPPSTRLEDRVYAASGRELLDVVRELTEDLDTVVLVGHNPGLEQLVRLLTGERVALPTSAVAVVALPGEWAGAGQTPAALKISGRPPKS
jgi:phosphohistidine phosphatase